MKPQVLMYNFAGDDRTLAIRRFLIKSHVEIIPVEPSQYMDPLGYLLGLPGFEKGNGFTMGGNFPDEMLVMNGFDEELLNAFLAFFRQESIKKVALKAMVTPVNQHWTSLKLYVHLSEEHQAMKERRRS